MKTPIASKRPDARRMMNLQPLLVVFTTIAVAALASPTTLAAPVASGRPQKLVSPGAVPEGLSAPEWSSIRQQYEQHRHAAFPVAGGHQARNPGQQWQTRFDGRGFTTQPDGAAWQWGLELKSYGFPGHERPIASQPRVTTAGQRVSYDWDATLQEWFVNDRRGLEHGFTVRERPSFPEPGSSRREEAHYSPPKDQSLLTPAATVEEESPLTFTLAVRGRLRPEVEADGRSVRFVDAEGTAALTYSELTVLDAEGRKLPARFEAVGSRRREEADSGAVVDAQRAGPVRLITSAATGSFRLVIDERGARYPLIIDPIAQQAYLKASNGGWGRWGGVEFGRSVAISGDTVVVGADMESSDATGVDGDQTNDNAQWSGAAYIFVRNGNTWSQQAYLKASNTGVEDNFGSQVAISGDTVVVGVRNEDGNATGINGDQASNSAANSGAAYVFVRSGTTWSQQAYLKASNTGASDAFGASVGVSGDTVVIGASGEDSNATGVNGDQASNSAANSGAAYVFVRSGTTWSQQTYLKASNTGASDAFGASVGVSGDTIVVSSPSEDSNATGVGGDQGNNSATDSGAAYVFVRNGTNWSQQAYLKASNTEAGDFFGGLAVSGDTLVVGATGEDSSATGVNGDNTATGSGAAYIFVRNGSIWSQQGYLKASNTEAGDSFGSSVAVAGDTVVIGAFQEDSSATGLDGDGSDNSAINSGAAYVFVRNGTTWTQQAYLKAANTDGALSGHCCGDYFGLSVGISGDTVLVGAMLEDSNATGVDGYQGDNSASVSGAAYVFTGLEKLTSVPSVKASRSGDSLVISWPASTNVFQLESTASAGSGSVWENVATPPVVIGDEEVVIIDIGPGSQFFRLRKP